MPTVSSTLDALVLYVTNRPWIWILGLVFLMFLFLRMFRTKGNPWVDRIGDLVCIFLAGLVFWKKGSMEDPISTKWKVVTTKPEKDEEKKGA